MCQEGECAEETPDSSDGHGQDGVGGESAEPPLDANGDGRVDAEETKAWLEWCSSAGCVREAGVPSGAALQAAARFGRAVVYIGYRNGRAVYVGITNNFHRRSLEHAGRFAIEQISAGMTRLHARAVEEALLMRNSGLFENIRHSISPNNPHYQQLRSWGEAWARARGYW